MQELKVMDDIHRLKLIIVGPPSVGKSSIVRSFGDTSFFNQLPRLQQPRNTIALDIIRKTINFQNKKVRLDLFDTAGGEIFKSLRGMYYQGAMGALLVYDVSDQDSFYRMKEFLDELRQAADEKIKIILVGNKIDVRERRVRRQDGEMFAKANGIMFGEVSAVSGENMEKVFSLLVEEILREDKFEKDFRKSRQLSVKVHQIEDTEEGKRRCC